MSRKNNVKAIATTGIVALGLASGNTILAQSANNTKINPDTTKNVQIKTDSTIIQNYNPIKIILPNTEYIIEDTKDPIYGYPTFYSLDGINKIIKRYNQKLLIPDTTKNGIGDIEMEYFGHISVPGLAEYSFTKQDKELMIIIGEAIYDGKITKEENKEIFDAKRKAKYFDDLKFLVQVHYNEVMKIVNDKKNIYPARDVVKEYMLKENTNANVPINPIGLNLHSQKTVRPYLEAFAVNSNLNKIMLQYSKEFNIFLTQIGAGLDFGKFDIGFTGAYSKFHKNMGEVFYNIQSNGQTNDSTFYKNGKMISIGANASFDISKTVSLCLGAQDNIIDMTVSGNYSQSVTDGVTHGYNKVRKPDVNVHTTYPTYSAGVKFNIGDHVSIPVGSKFTNKRFEGAYGGFRYIFGGNKQK